MVPWKGAMFSERLGVINDKMARNIQILTDNAMVNGWSVPDLSQAIREEVGIPLEERLLTRPRASSAKSRADMISRTEMMRAADLAKEKLYKDNKALVKDERWLASDLPNVCDECDMNNGKLFSDLGVRPSLHPRCACTGIPVLKSWGELLGPQFKDMRDMGIDEFEMKYPDPKSWREEKMNPKIVSVDVQPYDEWIEAQ
jgi:SPP1 gp7 family putative phage head morphogenesis protein